MKAHTESNRSLRLRSYFLIALLAGAVGVVKSFQATPTNGASVAATYSHGSLHVTIPYQSPRAGAGHLTIEVLDPEDGVLAARV